MGNNAIETLKRRIDILKENIKRNKNYEKDCNIGIKEVNKRLEESKISLKECKNALKILEHN